MFWKNKARDNFISLGDKNTLFFQKSVVINSNRHCILSLFHSNETRIFTYDQLKVFTLNFFKNLYIADGGETKLSKKSCFPLISHNSMLDILAGPTEEEILKVVNGMHPYKAAGPDGLSDLFYRSQWASIKNSLIQFIQRLFKEGFGIAEINQTIFSLIPKVLHPNLITQFRPMSLCNVDYKILSKILVTKIQPLLPKLIGEE